MSNTGHDRFILCDVLSSPTLDLDMQLVFTSVRCLNAKASDVILSLPMKNKFGLCPACAVYTLGTSNAIPGRKTDRIQI